MTDRGRAVAVLAPLPESAPLERLRAAGEVLPASGTVDDLPPPLPLPKGKAAPSMNLARLRRDER